MTPAYSLPQSQRRTTSLLHDTRRTIPVHLAHFADNVEFCEVRAAMGTGRLAMDMYRSIPTSTDCEGLWSSAASLSSSAVAEFVRDLQLSHVCVTSRIGQCPECEHVDIVRLTEKCSDESA